MLLAMIDVHSLLMNPDGPPIFSYSCQVKMVLPFLQGSEAVNISSQSACVYNKEDFIGNVIHAYHVQFVYTCTYYQLSCVCAPAGR